MAEKIMSDVDYIKMLSKLTGIQDDVCGVVFKSTQGNFEKAYEQLSRASGINNSSVNETVSSNQAQINNNFIERNIRPVLDERSNKGGSDDIRKKEETLKAYFTGKYGEIEGMRQYRNYRETLMLLEIMTPEAIRRALQHVKNNPIDLSKYH